MDGIGWAASAMAAARTRLDIAAQNLANGSSDGFRKRDARGFLTATGVRVAAVRSQEQGALRRTGRAFDLAIVGRGAFRLRSPDGRVMLTRDGAFTRDRFGRLIDDEGRILIGRRDAVVVPQDADAESMAKQLSLPRGSSLRSGFLESSNVDAIGEMIDVLAAQRSFETAQKVLSAIDQTRERASTQVAQLK